MSSLLNLDKTITEKLLSENGWMKHHTSWMFKKCVYVGSTGNISSGAGTHFLRFILMNHGEEWFIDDDSNIYVKVEDYTDIEIYIQSKINRHG